MVRELERPSAAPVTITVELPRDPDAAEHVAEGALGSVVGLLTDGVPVLLGTTEPDGPVLAAVTDRRGAGRRLARAVARPEDGISR
jgi:UDP:flavonoid glycosyltransferase YjiC (YdhE family)